MPTEMITKFSPPRPKSTAVTKMLSPLTLTLFCVRYLSSSSFSFYVFSFSSSFLYFFSFLFLFLFISLSLLHTPPSSSSQRLTRRSILDAWLGSLLLSFLHWFVENSTIGQVGLDGRLYEAYFFTTSQELHSRSPHEPLLEVCSQIVVLGGGFLPAKRGEQVARMVAGCSVRFVVSFIPNFQGRERAACLGGDASHGAEAHRQRRAQEGVGRGLLLAIASHTLRDGWLHRRGFAAPVSKAL